LKAVPPAVEGLSLPTQTQIPAIGSKALTVFSRDQGIYLFVAFVGCAIFWAIGQPINPLTVILYSLCIGNFLSPPLQWLQACTKNLLLMTG
jgi:hypothetical protein